MRAGDMLKTGKVHTVGLDERDDETGAQLLVSKCWCDWRYVLVTADEIAAGRTRPCSKGLVRCHA